MYMNLLNKFKEKHNKKCVSMFTFNDIKNHEH